MRDRLFLTGTISFLGGVLARSFFVIDTATVLFCALIGVALILLFLISHTRQGALLVLGIILVAMPLGVLRFSQKDSGLTDATLDARIGRTAVIAGVVSETPVQGDTSRRITVRVDSVDGNAMSRTTRVTTSVPRYPDIVYGDRVTVRGVVALPESFATDNGREFDYRNYLKARGVAYTLRYPKVTVDAHGAGNQIIGTLYAIKSRFVAGMQSVVPEPYAAILAGIVIGEQNGIPTSVEDTFKTAGIVHVLVLSGYNLTIVADSLSRFLSAVSVPLRAASGVGIVSIILFALMSGGAGATVRAAIMSVVVVIARVSGRTYAASRALLLSAVLMVLWNPFSLAFDPSFQLSFLATVGLIYASPFVDRVLIRFHLGETMRGFLGTTLATQLLVLPLLLYRTGLLSTVAPLVNVLVLGMMPFAMLFGFLVGVTGMIAVPLALPFGFVAYLTARYTLTIAEWGAGLPFASVAVPLFPWWIVGCIYTLFVFVYIRITQSASRRGAGGALVTSV